MPRKLLIMALLTCVAVGIYLLFRGIFEQTPYMRSTAIALGLWGIFVPSMLALWLPSASARGRVVAAVAGIITGLVFAAFAIYGPVLTGHLGWRLDAALLAMAIVAVGAWAVPAVVTVAILNRA